MISKIIPEECIQQVRKLLDKHDNIVIVCHVSPDGDAIGSSLGLYHFLEEIGKRVTVIVPDSLPKNLLFLKGVKDILIYTRYPEYAQELIEQAELIFCLDFNALSRLGDLEEPIGKASAKKVMVDHHLYPEPFCDVTISHPQVSSTCELVFRLICRMGMFEYLTLKSANAIYVGMMTDTGNFTYNSNKPEMYFIVGELIKKGINKDDLYAKVCNTNSLDKLRLNGFAIHEKLTVFEPHHTAMITLTKDELKKFHYQKGDSEGLVNVPLSIPGIVFSAFFREEDDFIKVSLRSKGEFPANKVAEEWFNGGGHLNAAGGEFYGTMDEIITRFVKLLPQYDTYLNSETN